MDSPDQRLYLPALREHRARSLVRRAVAFCEVPEYVLGTPVKPLSPATFSMLLATRSAFVTGAPPQLDDVIYYIWFHSPLYTHTGIEGWEHRKKWALAKLNFEIRPLWRKWLGLKPDPNRARAALAIACAEIKTLVEEAFADSPAKTGRPGKPIATLEAFMIHEFAIAYKWAPEQTRNMPLRQLNQLHRCIRSANGEDLIDEAEDRILAAHLDKRQAAVDAQKAKNGVHP